MNTASAAFNGQGRRAPVETTRPFVEAAIGGSGLALLVL
jgi:hypothetical protein